MKVKYLQGDRSAIYAVVLPEDKEITDLVQLIQDYIANLGKLKQIHAEDLSNKTDKMSSKICEEIRNMGASLRKTNITPHGIQYTFPPFSELDQI